MSTEVFICALTANFMFALSVQVFAHYSKSVSPAWMNYFKAFVALIGFAATVIIVSGSFIHPLRIITMLVLSGAIGLAVGDFCLLAAFREMGPGRAMVLMSTGPLIMFGLSYWFHNKGIESQQVLAIGFMIACMLTISMESFKKNSHWHLKGIILVITAVILDSLGGILVKEVSESYGQISDFEGNVYRCLGAVTFFVILSVFKPLKLFKNFKGQSTKGKVLILIASILGTFVALTLLYRAIRLIDGNLALITGINVTGSVLATIFECIHRKVWPSRYLIIAIGFMIVGLYIFYI